MRSVGFCVVTRSARAVTTPYRERKRLSGRLTLTITGRECPQSVCLRCSMAA